MKVRLIVVLALAALVSSADPRNVAAHLAKEARRAQNAGQIVRAYLLYAEAAARDPHTVSYAVNRDALAPAAQLFTKANIESADIAPDIRAAETAPESAVEPPADAVSLGPLTDEHLQPPPRLQPSPDVHDFDLRLDEKPALTQVANAYGIDVVFDPDFDVRGNIRFVIDHADFRAAMEGVTAVTHTFVFPLSAHRIFVARDTEPKRNEFEPVTMVTVQLPDAVDFKEVTDAANAVRGALSLRGGISWDSSAKTVFVRDRVSRARIARSLLEALILPKAQVSLDVQLLTVDSDVNYHYGLALPTSFQIYDFFKIGGFQTLLPNITNVGQVFAFGIGRAFFGVTLTDATLFATYTKSSSRNFFDATVVLGDRQTATLHVGDKYPIPQSLYSGFQQSGGGSIYNPIGQVTQEDLGLELKLGARVSGDGDVSLDVEAAYKALGTLTLNTVPSIAQREFKGTIRLREGEWAILAGMDEQDHTVSRSGIAGLAQIPGINQALSENTRDNKASNTLILIKPSITRLPMASWISPQYFLGPQHGERVLM